MAPTHLVHAAGESLLHSLSSRAATSPGDSIPLVSVFALVGASGSRTGYTLGSRSLFEETALADPYLQHLEKRQQYILAIPTTYDTIDNSPAPGAVAGITLGAVLGSILILWLILLVISMYFRRGRVVKTEIIEKHNHRHRSRSRRSRSRGRGETERRTRTTQEVRIERSVSRPPESVVVEEEEDDIVEVIEEHSPERRPSKRNSGFRTVDPAEFGGGNAPRRKLSRR
ncbi:uncharacterized protein AB675_10498 [Cyphellophora attinorum]|uniref:Uncharacterized protein n=1 Tax=Cyphellophora attinorum TaxID=1664694 RepID=A0A0N1H452_9EURO|nr:uncharacterized protein AB675_10498 [Phialophora attinorum]KPI35876.1 hypothetical protein AB675_10498 [Phialophora attinorum]